MRRGPVLGVKDEGRRMKDGATDLVFAHLGLVEPVEVMPLLSKAFFTKPISE